jgi:hypothetical protein
MFEGISSRLGKAGGSKLAYGALAVSAALIALSAFSSKRPLSSASDVSREPYGGGGRDARGGAGYQQTARIAPEMPGSQGYTTNIDMQMQDDSGTIDAREFSNVMDRHVRTSIGGRGGRTNMEINDNSDRSSDQKRKRQYSSMLRG